MVGAGLFLALQATLTPKLKTTYGKPQYNYIKGERQRIELHRGCPWGHEYCYEPKVYEDFPVPVLERNYVEILDMNPLARQDILSVIKELGNRRVNGKVIHFEAVCGFDFRFLTKEIAIALRQSRFVKPRLAWDGPFQEQYKLKDAIKILLQAGYRAKEISLFMLVNWRIPYKVCLRKLDLMKVWNVKVNDCCYDGGYKYAVPIFWTGTEMKAIRKQCRRHNHMVNFGIDPRPLIAKRVVSMKTL
jgi:hypothetical protein